MGLLEQLWDDTVAGPRPENGLGKLRKPASFSFRSGSGKEQGESVKPLGDDTPEEAVRVTRRIMIVKPPGYMSGSPPVSPAGSTPPVSPFFGKVIDENPSMFPAPNPLSSNNGGVWCILYLPCLLTRQRNPSAHGFHGIKR